MSLFNKLMFGNDKIKLPETRFKQFFYIFKENLLLLFYTGLFSFLFLAPTIYIILSTYTRYYKLITSESINSSEIMQLLLSCGILLIFSISFLGIGISGIYNIIIKLAFNEGARFKDYFIGIKQNILKFLIIYFIEGVLIFFLLLNYGAYYFLPINKYMKLFALIISTLFLLIYMLVKPFILVQLMVFKNNKIQLIKNSFLLMISKLIPALFIFIITNFLYALLLIFIGAPLIITMILIIMFQNVYSSLINVLFVINTYEGLIDKNDYKEIYHKGLKDYEESQDF